MVFQRILHAITPKASPYSAFTKALGEGDEDTLCRLVADSRFPCNEQDAQGDTPLHWLCRKGFTRAAMQLAARPDILWLRNAAQMTPLQLAIMAKQEDVALRMVQLGAPCNDTTQACRAASAPLQMACNNGMEALTKAMIARGADITIRTRSDRGLLYYACHHSLEPFAIELMDRGLIPNEEEYAAALDQGLDEVASTMITRGLCTAEVIMKGMSTKSVLSHALEHGMLQTARAILPHTSDRTIREEWETLSCKGVEKESLEPLFLNILGRGPLLSPQDCRHLLDDQLKTTAVEDMTRQFINTVILPASICLFPTEDYEKRRNQLAKKIMPHHNDTGRGGNGFRAALLARNGGQGVTLPEPKQEDGETLNSYPLFSPVDPRALEQFNTLLLSLRHHQRTPEQIAEAIANHTLTQQLLRPNRLARTWHHPTITLPYSSGRAWHSLLSHDVALGGGLALTCLTNHAQLLHESKALSHCVGQGGSYEEKCCNPYPWQQSHILSIRDRRNGQDTPLSTLEVRLCKRNKGERMPPDAIPLAGTDCYLSLLQHQGENNRTPTGRVRAAFTQFCQSLREDPAVAACIVTDPQQLGETSESRAKSSGQPLQRITGYPGAWEKHPTMDLPERMFNEFRKSIRASTAAVGNHERRRIYAVASAPDGYSHWQHFIDGYVQVDAHNKPVGEVVHEPAAEPLPPGNRWVSLRPLDLRSWMEMVGITPMLRHAQEMPEPAHIPLHETPVPLAKPEIWAAYRHNHAASARDKGAKGAIFM